MKIYWDGKIKNLVGPKVKELRIQKKLTQKNLAIQLQLLGYEFNELTILRIEQQTRFVSDIELLALATFFDIEIRELYPKEKV
ncbi:MAG: helix-turn-helix transcriptional regulator [Lachnospiraceae bacterium]|nr:helix-turn-helix transcriptional regulator [Lachnospiraceae bacterium]